MLFKFGCDLGLLPNTLNTGSPVTFSCNLVSRKCDAAAVFIMYIHHLRRIHICFFLLLRLLACLVGIGRGYCK